MENVQSNAYCVFLDLPLNLIDFISQILREKFLEIKMITLFSVMIDFAFMPVRVSLNLNKNNT